jgi:hypothetical protein
MALTIFLLTGFFIISTMSMMHIPAMFLRPPSVIRYTEISPFVRIFAGTFMEGEGVRVRVTGT